MAFDGPYPSHSDSMERVIFNALLSPSHDDMDDVMSTSASSTRQNFKFTLPFRNWFRSSHLVRRIRSFREHPDASTLASSSSLSLTSIAADEILVQLPEGTSCTSKLIKSIQDMDRCFTRSAVEEMDSDTTETTCMRRCGSLTGTTTTTPNACRVPHIPAGGVNRTRSARATRRRRALKIKERYLEVNDGVWDTVGGILIPNAWPVGRVKTAIKKPKMARKT
ncbi:hypothetical protein H072_11472 [Dactylellina haptotyla CBS 200.50]|uniref:Uncharacterized protein n=1 Tax=Dactylellina haptotyla (strain CBS 200.50) TaxID=1284197 RepID=S7ZXN4_DACHA|nr:hypothetical protein H072_11472 [Dactylellina haptotyla CBS 200.50]